MTKVQLYIKLSIMVVGVVAIITLLFDLHLYMQSVFINNKDVLQFCSLWGVLDIFFIC